MATLTINTISEKDVEELYSRSKVSKFVLDDSSPPSSPPMSPNSKHAIKLTSGKRTGIVDKNDPTTDRKSERRVSSKMDNLEEPKEKLVTFTPVKIEITKNNDERNTLKTSNEEIIPVLVSDNREIKDEKKEINKPKEVSKEETDKRKEEGKVKVKSNPRTLTSIIEEERKSPRIEKIPASPPAERRHESSRSPVNSGYKNGNEYKKDYRSAREEREADERLSNRRNLVDQRSTRTKSSKSTKRKKERVESTSPTDKIRPKSPHRHDKQIGIRIGGEQISSGEYTRLDESSSSLSQRPRQPTSERSNNRDDNKNDTDEEGDEEEDSSKSEVSSRSKIINRKDRIDKKLSEKYKDKEFYPEDDEHLRDAIKIALEESKKQSIKEARDQGLELSARVLSSMTRPNAIEEVIEEMVSQRRERILESRRQAELSKKKQPRKKENKPERENKTTTKQEPKPIKKQITPQKKVEKKEVLQNDSEPEIQTVEEPTIEEKIPKQTQEKNEKVEQAKEVEQNAKPDQSKPKFKITQENNLPGENIFSKQDIKEITNPENTTNVEVLRKPVEVENKPQDKIEEKPKRKPRKVILLEDDESSEEIITVTKRTTKKDKEKLKAKKEEEEEDINEEDEKDESEEKNVKLPPAQRKRKTNEIIESPFLLNGKDEDYAYDPLGIGDELNIQEAKTKKEVYDPYVESEEDEAKLTIDEKKDEMMYRFRCVQESYPHVALPRITKQMKLAKMCRLYDHVMSKIKLKVKTRNFKIFLMGGFLAMQFLGNKLGLDMQGFTVNQMHSINIYNRLLNELGESDWTGIGVELPVLVRLPFFMCVNAGIFIVAKFVFKKTGHDYTQEFHKIYASLVGGDDFAYVNDEGGSKGLDEGNEGGDGDGGGIFGIIKSFLGMMGGGNNNDEDKPKRGNADGPMFKRKRKKATTKE